VLLSIAIYIASIVVLKSKVKQRHKHWAMYSINVPKEDKMDHNTDSLHFDEKTSKELTELEEISAKLNTLIDVLNENGVINKKVYERTLAMRLHEISKATVFAEMSD
jgi:hypothetical protein